MVESSKILTVSYGTFSCTLEGFDDSFGTMKAIAEYFRDLAAGDRYFGAEPPTPDAEMLARIAEREISRRVELRTSDSGIVLRASDHVPQSGAAVAQVTATPAGPAPAPEQAATAAKTAPEAEVAAVAETAPEQAAPVAEDDADAQVASVAEEAAEAHVAEDEAAEIEASATMEAEPVMPPALRRPAMTRFVASVATKIDETDITSDTPPMPRVTRRNEAPAHPDSDSVAAKLQRIRAVVGGVTPAPAIAFAEDLEENEEAVTVDGSVSEQAEEHAALAAAIQDVVPDETTEVETAEGTSAAPAAPVIDAAPDEAEGLDDTPVMSAEFVPDAVVEADEEPAETDETDDQINAVLRNLERAGLRSVASEPQAEVAAAAETEADVAAVADVEAEAESEAPQTGPRPLPLRARILRVARRPRFAETEAESDTPMAAAPVEETPVVEDLAVDALTADAAPETELAQDSQDPAAPVAGLDDDGDTLLDDGVIGQDDLTGFDTAAAHSTLSDSDEADLQRELAAVAAETAGTDVAAAVTPLPLRRDPLPGTTEAEMSRIMSQADQQLADPEASRRRNAIAHLKAAVAATEAARQLGEPDMGHEAAEGAFRDDLQQVVRPRRAALSDTPAERSERPRPAPLKLVASQRVDIAQEKAAPQAPVQPRRVSTAMLDDDSNADSFAEFAEQMGASSLQDMLEAAAAYIAFVEGVEDFSRPQIMKKVQQTVTEDFSREDGLRSFGTLLRQGRIAKVRNGRFQVSERTRFKPEARVAEG